MHRPLGLALSAAALLALAAPAAAPAAQVWHGALAEWERAVGDVRGSVRVDLVEARREGRTSRAASVWIRESHCDAATGELVTRTFAGGGAAAPGSAGVPLAGESLAADVVVEGVETRAARCAWPPPPGSGRTSQLGSFRVRVAVEWEGRGVATPAAWPLVARGCQLAGAGANGWREAAARGTVTGSLPLERLRLSDAPAARAELYAEVEAHADGCAGG